MNVNKIFYFLEVCKCKSISIASDSMNISQPAVTKAMKELECELGYSLFAREHNKMALTPEGRAFFEMATRFKMNYNDFIAEATDLGTFKQKTIRIGIPTIMGTLTINKILPEFTRQYPSLKLEIFCRA